MINRFKNCDQLRHFSSAFCNTSPLYQTCTSQRMIEVFCQINVIKILEHFDNYFISSHQPIRLYSRKSFVESSSSLDAFTLLMLLSVKAKLSSGFQYNGSLEICRRCAELGPIPLHREHSHCGRLSLDSSFCLSCFESMSSAMRQTHSSSPCLIGLIEW